MTDKTIVLFRAEKHGNFKGDVTAVFPCIPGSSEHDMSCYVHIGQHSSCTMEWYYTTRPARPEEYADLKTELENYGSTDSRYSLDIRRRMPNDAHEKRRQAMREMDRATADH